MQFRFFGLFLILALFFTATTSYSQPPPMLWSQEFSRPGDQRSYSAVQTTDGGFVLVGSTDEDNESILLIKVANNGMFLWSQTYHTETRDVGFDIKETIDGGFIITGYVTNWSNYQTLLMKTDSLGTVEWSYTLGSGIGKSVQQTSDGSYIVVGATRYYGVLSDVKLYKIDQDGNTMWSQTYSGNNGDVGNSVQETTDGGYIIAGNTNDDEWGATNVWLIKTDSEGNEVWNQIIGGNSFCYGMDVDQTADGGYIIVGGLNFSLYLVKTDAVGSVEWTMIYHGREEASGSSVQQTIDGNYILAGTNKVHWVYEYNIWVLKVNPQGQIIWDYIHGNILDRDYGQSVQQTADGGYIVGGYANRDYDNDNAIIFKLDNDEPAEPGPLVTISLMPFNTPIQIPPEGGSFVFSVVSTNSVPEPTLAQAWAVVELPNGRNYIGPELFRQSLVFQPGQLIFEVNFVQSVPSYAPAGTYIYKGRIGFYPNDIYAQDSFEFEKLGEDSR
jgi:hypothetical protein